MPPKDAATYTVPLPIPRSCAWPSPFTQRSYSHSCGLLIGVAVVNVDRGSRMDGERDARLPRRLRRITLDTTDANSVSAVDIFPYWAEAPPRRPLGLRNQRRAMRTAVASPRGYWRSQTCRTRRRTRPAARLHALACVRRYRRPWTFFCLVEIEPTTGPARRHFCVGAAAPARDSY
jgi:hypothetical protein